MFECNIMRHLIAQITKFGIVGVLAAVIDFGILNALVKFAHMNNVVAGTISFLIALAFNYILSMKMVFTHRDDMAKWMEMFIFAVSAALGLLMNDVIIWLATINLPSDAVYTMHSTYILYTNIGKVVATVVVAVWNFIIRKVFLDAPNSTISASRLERSLSHRIGRWSMNHNPFGSRT
ncbi:sugar translocase [Bifidobacterium aquikefiri]|uniref:Sugar translocase n=2 Tax=Bifidobacterium aquikefiri TaxID=1653207 RepID=A0A261G8M4_9BIFI|nr:sugar translocase [Bifidobacterium aquikefiri]